MLWIYKKKLSGKWKRTECLYKYIFYYISKVSGHVFCVAWRYYIFLVWISLLFLYYFWISCRIWFSFSLIFSSLFLLVLFLSQIVGEFIKDCHKLVPSIIMPAISDTLCIYRQGLIHNILREQLSIWFTEVRQKLVGN